MLEHLEGAVENGGGVVVRQFQADKVLVKTPVGPRWLPIKHVFAVHVHAALLVIWMALLIVQPLAIRRRAFSVHRILGRASYCLMPFVLIVSIAMLRKEYLENVAAGMNVLAAKEAEYLSTIQLISLATFYGLAIIRIGKGDAMQHMRYMICIALALLPAGLARTMGYWFNVSQTASQTTCLAVIDFCLISLIAFDKKHRMVAQPYVVALAMYLIWEAGLAEQSGE